MPLIELDANINDPIFADRATEVFLELCGQPGWTASHAAESRTLP
jgi:hypothetical protein